MGQLITYMTVAALVSSLAMLALGIVIGRSREHSRPGGTAWAHRQAARAQRDRADIAAKLESAFVYAGHGSDTRVYWRS